MSVGPGEVLDLRKNRWIRNVCWSSDDPRFKNKGWIRVWEEFVHMTASQCCVCGERERRIIGGHVILGQGYTEWPGEAADDDSLQGSDRVFIAPICDSCNSREVPLKVQYDTKILQLCGYYQWEPEEITDEQITGRVDKEDRDYLQNGHSSDAASFSIPARSSQPAYERWKRHSTRDNLYDRDAFVYY